MSTVEKNYNDSIDFENPFIKKIINYVLVKLNIMKIIMKVKLKN